MIIGITGTNGAGKGTVVEYLVTQKGFKHYSGREYLIEEIKKRNLPVDRSSMRLVGNDLRATHSPSYLAEVLYARAKGGGVENAVIESIRNSGEAKYLKSEGVFLWAVDADRRVRYERIYKRASETDRLDFDTFVLQEEREWHGAEGKTDMDVQNVIAMSDAVLTNNGLPEELFAQVEEALKKIKEKE